MHKLQKMKCKVVTVVLSGPSDPPVTSVPIQNSELMYLIYPLLHLKTIIVATLLIQWLFMFLMVVVLLSKLLWKGRGNPLFSFLFELGSKEHIYYVWRLYSFTLGDTLQRWRTEPFIMLSGRQKLRRIEVVLIKYSESLEEQGTKNMEEIERKVANHRKRLQFEYNLMESSEDASSNRRSSAYRREKRDGSHGSSRKRHCSHSGSESPQHKSSSRDWDRDRR